ncbi:MAG: thioredoxin [Thermoflexia bacterium]|nr:MAG: thioredoxin [Thermoflexia bacterium]
MEDGTVKEVTDATFEQEVLQSPIPTLVDFWAAWCGPCRMIAPIVEDIAQEFEGRVAVVKMDVDANPKTPARLGILGIPTLILFKDGKEVDRIVGYRPKQAVRDFLAAHL